MLISISHALRETWVVGIALLVVLLVSLRRRTDTTIFPLTITTELKGFAILLVVFSHIGYFLVNDHTFLVPFSNYAGVGVDLFLILSGFGLATSALRQSTQTAASPVISSEASAESRNPLTPCDGAVKRLPFEASRDLRSPRQPALSDSRMGSVGMTIAFYKKRLAKIYLSVALILVLLLLTDYFFLHRAYPLSLTIKNFLGFFPEADSYKDINSPLWFITPLLFFYLLFPIIFYRRFPLLSGIVFMMFGWYLAEQPLRHYIPSLTESVEHLYRLHALSFGVGVMFASVINKITAVISSGANEERVNGVEKSFDRCVARVKRLPFEASRDLRSPRQPALSDSRMGSVGMTIAIRTLIIIAGIAIWYYYSLHSPVGADWHRERLITLILCLAAVAIFLAKPIVLKFLSLLGAYSFEIYLLHWPLLYRYDFLYHVTPASFATILSLSLCLVLAWIFQKIINQYLPKLTTTILARSTFPSPQHEKGRLVRRSSDSHRNEGGG